MKPESKVFNSEPISKNMINVPEEEKQGQSYISPDKPALQKTFFYTSKRKLKKHNTNPQLNTAES